MTRSNLDCCFRRDSMRKKRKDARMRKRVVGMVGWRMTPLSRAAEAAPPALAAVGQRRGRKMAEEMVEIFIAARTKPEEVSELLLPVKAIKPYVRFVFLSGRVLHLQ